MEKIIKRLIFLYRIFNFLWFLILLNTFFPACSTSKPTIMLVINPELNSQHTTANINQQKMIDQNLKILKTNPSNITASSNLASIYFSTNNFLEGLKYTGKVLYEHLNQPLAQKQLLWAYLRQKKYILARFTVEKMLSKDPDSAELLNILGVLQYFDKEVEKAEKSWLKGLENDSKHNGILLNLATLSLFKRNYKDSISYYKAISQKDLKDPSIYINRAIAYAAVAEMDQAKKNLELAYDTDANNNMILLNLGVFNYYINKDFEDASEYFNKCLKGAPKNSRIYEIAKKYLQLINENNAITKLLDS